MFKQTGQFVGTSTGHPVLAHMWSHYFPAFQSFALFQFLPISTV